MFDIGWTEFLWVAVVAIIVIGPKDLPKAMQTVGKWVRKARHMVAEFQRGLDDVVRDAELDEMRDVAKLAKSGGLGKVISETVDPTGGLTQLKDETKAAADEIKSVLEDKPIGSSKISTKPDAQTSEHFQTETTVGQTETTVGQTKTTVGVASPALPHTASLESGASPRASSGNLSEKQAGDSADTVQHKTGYSTPPADETASATQSQKSAQRSTKKSTETHAHGTAQSGAQPNPSKPGPESRQKPDQNLDQNPGQKPNNRKLGATTAPAVQPLVSDQPQHSVSAKDNIPASHSNGHIAAHPAPDEMAKSAPPARAPKRPAADKVSPQVSAQIPVKIGGKAVNKSHSSS